MWVLVALIALGGVLGLIVRRAWAIAIAAACIVGYYIGLDSGWWGDGTGDGWEAVMVFMSAVAAVVAWAGTVLGRHQNG